jgi:hypothetical protein
MCIVKGCFCGVGAEDLSARALYQVGLALALSAGGCRAPAIRRVTAWSSRAVPYGRL